MICEEESDKTHSLRRRLQENTPQLILEVVFVLVLTLTLCVTRL